MKNKYFPEAEELNLFEAVKTRKFELDNTVVMISVLEPGAVVEMHDHQECQIGLILSGTLEMTVGNDTRVLNQYEGYHTRPNEPHAARNVSGEKVIALDVKRDVEFEYDDDFESFLNFSVSKVWKNGLIIDFMVGGWFEIMKSEIPPTGEMPRHKHANEQIGISLKGQYIMEVDKVEKLSFAPGDVYYSPPFTEHYAINDTQETAESLNIFIPKRYNKKKRDVQQ